MPCRFLARIQPYNRTHQLVRGHRWANLDGERFVEAAEIPGMRAIEVRRAHADQGQHRPLCLPAASRYAAGMDAYVLEAMGEEAVLLRLGDQVAADTNRAVHALAKRLRARAPAWLRDCVPAYATLALFVDTDIVGCDPLRRVAALLRELEAAPDVTGRGHGAVLEVPVCYDSDFAPDLAALAAHAGLTTEEVIRRHHAPVYQVAMTGFAPGFPYLLGLDPLLAMPRLGTPRTSVPAGSVAIGGAQAGIYPRESPGGWRLLGRTPLTLFDARRDPPALLSPGDRLCFVPIDRLRFDSLSENRTR